MCNSICIKFDKKFYFSFRIFSFQISDWLNLDQNMAKNYSVDVGDHEAITEAIGKQKVSKIEKALENKIKFIEKCVFLRTHLQTVVRELESKKPQLDELILIAEALKADGSRQKLCGKSE